MKTVLVVFMDGEETLFLKLEVNDAALKLLKTFHNQFINGTNDKVIKDQINSFFYDEKHRNRYKEEDIGKKPIEKTKFDLIIYTGCLP